MAGLFNFPPFDQSGSTGFLDPALAYQAQASLLGQQGQPAPQPQQSGMNFGSGGSIWPTLMGLGAGIASGNGWGEGVGKGLMGGAALSQQQRENEIRQQAYALQQSTLENELRHQGVMESIAKQQANTAETTRTDAIDIRRSGEAREQSKLAGPVNLIKSGIKQYPAAREAILSGRWETATGPGVNAVRNMIIGAAKINGDNPKELFETMLPTPIDGQDTRLQKLQMLEDYVNGVGPIIEQNYPALGSQADFAISPATPPGSTVAPKGAPIQAGVMPERSGGGAGMIPPSAVQYLKANANNPAVIEAFRQKYGQDPSAFLR